MKFEEAWALQEPGQPISKGDVVIEKGIGMSTDIVRALLKGANLDEGWKLDQSKEKRSKA